jgi:hypothetical protein
LNINQALLKGVRMRNKNWTTIGIVVLIAGLLYYFFMQEGCMRSGKGSRSDMATSVDVESDLDAAQGNDAENRGMQEDVTLEAALEETVVE